METLAPDKAGAGGGEDRGGQWEDEGLMSVE